jgi:hypothetical protein
MPEIAVFIGLYVLYAFTQASVMVKYKLCQIGDEPIADLLGFAAFAPIFTLIGIFYYPAIGLNKYAEFLAR